MKKYSEDQNLITVSMYNRDIPYGKHVRDLVKRNISLQGGKKLTTKLLKLCRTGNISAEDVKQDLEIRN